MSIKRKTVEIDVAVCPVCGKELQAANTHHYLEYLMAFFNAAGITSQDVIMKSQVFIASDFAFCNECFEKHAKQIAEKLYQTWTEEFNKIKEEGDLNVEEN